MPRRRSRRSSGGAAAGASSSAPTSQGAVRPTASMSPNTKPVRFDPAFQAELPDWMCRFSLVAVVLTKLRLASVAEATPAPRGFGPMSAFHWRAGGAASPAMLFPLAAFHQSQLAALVQSADPFQVASGACTSSTRMLLRRTT